MRLRYLCKLPNGINWVLLWEGPCSVKLESSYLLMGGTVLPPSDLFGLRQPSPGASGLCGSVNGNLSRGPCPGAPSRSAASGAHVKPLLANTSTRDPPTWAGSLVQSSVGSLLLPPGSWCTRNFVFALQGVVSVSPCPTGKPNVWLRTLHSGRTSLILLFSSLWVAHLAGMGFDFIPVVPLLLYHCCFLLVFGCIFFWMGSSILLWMFVQQLVVILVLLQEMSAHASVPPSWASPTS